MSENQLTTLYFKPPFNTPEYPRKWHIVKDLDTPLCGRKKFESHTFEVTDEVPDLGDVCHACRCKADPEFKEASREAARERQREQEARYREHREKIEAEKEAEKDEIERKRQLNSIVIDTIEDFQRKLTVEGQLYAQMLRTIAWIRGYKAFWVVKTFKDISGVNITIDLVQNLGNEMPTQEVLDTVNEQIAKYHQQKLK